MIVIDLDKNEGNFGEGFDEISIENEPYSYSDLFTKVSHKVVRPNGYRMPLVRFKSDKLGRTYYLGHKITSYFVQLHSPLNYVELYHSKFNNELLVLSTRTKNQEKYYNRSFLNSINLWKDINNLHGFKVENLFDILIDENYKTNSTITYRLDLKDGKSYSNVKVQKFEHDPFPGFVKYTHEPKDENKKSVILFSDQLIKTSKGNLIQNRDYNCVIAYYLINEYEDPFPLLIILNDINSGNIYFKIKDTLNNGWEEMAFPPSVSLTNEQKIEYILKQFDYKKKKSIMIFLHEKNGHYDLKLIGNDEDSLITSSETFKKVSVTEQTTDSTYKCYKHELEQKSKMDQNNDILGLRLFLPKNRFYNSPVEVQLNIKRNAKQFLYYLKDVDGPSVYFYNHDSNVDTVPLLVHYFNKWYSPHSKNSYFTDWDEVTTISGTTDNREIVRELTRVNNILNEIDIKLTTDYGITHSGISLFQHDGFNSKRVEVKREQPESKYRVVKHSTVNKKSIGNIICDGSILNGISSTDYISSNPNQAILYYHESDQQLRLVLLISVGSDSGIHNIFYERRSNKMTYEFKKCESQLSLGDQLAGKINELYYNFNKSISIELNQSTGNYTPKLIDNSNEQHKQDTSKNVVATSDSSCISDSNYKCRKHDISAIDRSNVGGLRISINDNEIQTYDKAATHPQPIYYRSDQLSVYVYFYNTDDVPLLLKYNNLYYSPHGINDYFSKWRLVDDNDIVTKLDQINKGLNRIDISKTNGEYGIPRQLLPVESYSSFYNRIKVTQQTESNYREVTHTTKNHFSIGKITFKGTPLEGIQPSETSSATQVDVYYTKDDSTHKHALLIRLSSQNGIESDIWFKRGNIEGTLWEKVTDPENIGTSNRILGQLNELKRELFKTVFIKLEKDANYETSTEFTNLNGRDLVYNKQIKVDKFGNTGYKYVDHRPHEHKITEHYEANTHVFPNSDSEIKFEIIPEISGSKIDVYCKDGNPYPLYYKYTRQIHKHNLFVYFYTGNTLEDDTIPLLFEYSDKFYAPTSKSYYFTKWKEVAKSNDHDIENKVKQKLAEVNKMLNEIDLLQVSDYGLPNPSYTTPKFNAVRVNVTSQQQSNYKKVTHSTLNGFNIGKINHKDFTFEDYSEKVEEKMNEVVVFFLKTNTDYTEPKLVLINSKESFTSDTHGYYDLTKEQYDKVYKFTKLKDPQSLDEIIEKNGSFDGIDMELGQVFQQILDTPAGEIGDLQQSNALHVNGQTSSDSVNSSEPATSAGGNSFVSQENFVQSSGTPVPRSDDSDDSAGLSTTKAPEGEAISEPGPTISSEPEISPEIKVQPSLTQNTPSQQNPSSDSSSGSDNPESTGSTPKNEDQSNNSTDIITFLKDNVAAVSGGAAGSVVLTAVSGYGIYRRCIKVK